MRTSKLIFAFVLLHVQLFGQVDKTTVDSLIITKTDKNFLNYLTFRQKINQTVWDENKISKNSDKIEIKQKDIEVDVETFSYDLKTKTGESFYYRMGGLTSSSIDINFDRNREMINPPPFSDLYKLRALYDLKTIDKMQAIETATPYLTNKKVKANECLLIYDLDKALIYWEVKSKKGNKNTIEKSVLINAQTNEYIRTNEFKYQRRLL